MNLAIVRRRLDSIGGAERFIVDAMRALDAEGLKLTLVAQNAGKSLPEGTEVLSVSETMGSRAKRYRDFQQGVAAALSGRKFDIVQSHERIVGADIFRAGDGVHAAWVDRLARERSPLSRPILRLSPFHRLLIETEKRMAQQAGLTFVANSQLVASELSGYYGIPASRLKVIENGVDLDVYTPPTPQDRLDARRHFGLSADQPVAAFIGSGFERKGAFQLIQALALPALDGVALLIAGRDKQFGDLEKGVERLGLQSRVRILGQMPNSKTVLHASDLMVLPTLYDPMPNATLEAIACGLPVVTTADAGIAGAVEKHGAGLVSTRDPDDLASAIRKVLDALPRFSASALSIRVGYDQRDKMRQWQALYRELS